MDKVISVLQIVRILITFYHHKYLLANMSLNVSTAEVALQWTDKCQDHAYGG